MSIDRHHDIITVIKTIIGMKSCKVLLSPPHSSRSILLGLGNFTLNVSFSLVHCLHRHSPTHMTTTASYLLYCD